MPEHFIVAGAQRCGSTSLYHLLDEHPEILMAKPLRPEPKYFLTQRDTPSDYQKYLETYFPKHQRFKILGEKSVVYLEKEEAAKHIQRLLPDARIVIILRDPALRAVSNYWFTRHSGLEKRSLEEAFAVLEDKKPGPEGKNISASPYRYLGRGHYADFIEPFEKIFGRERLLIMILENFQGNAAELKKLYRFLDVNPDFMPASLNLIENESERTNEKLSDETFKRLISHFRESNTRLARSYRLDIRQWL